MNVWLSHGLISLRSGGRRRALVLGLAVTVLGGGVCFGQNTQADLSADVNDFVSMNLEQLMRMKVTSVAGVGAQWFKTPAAMTVITADDIRRTGHTSLAEALRLAPGLHVAQVNSSVGAIAHVPRSVYANVMLRF